MSEPNTAHLRPLLKNTIGPSPWYWQTFPSFQSLAGQRFFWTHQGSEGSVAYVVSLALDQQPEKPRLALNTYCRPFLVPPHLLGIWAPAGRNLRLSCFDPDQLKVFDITELAGWFKQSADRIYAATPPVAEFEVPVSLAAGSHPIEVPPEFAGVDELIIPTSYKAMSNDDPAFALFVIDFQNAKVEVLPQKWFTAAQYDIGPKWIPRAARDPESQRICGECFGVGEFLLDEDGCRLDRWVAKTPL
jgi:hypothetical protein